MKNEKDTTLRVEKGGGSLTVDKQGVIEISAQIITVKDFIDGPVADAGGSEKDD